MRLVQFICDGKLDSLLLNKADQTFAGDIKLSEPQFVEIRAGNTKPQYYYLLPNEKISITIDKPSMQETVVTIANGRSSQLQEIFNTYYTALQEKGINTKSRDWHRLLFNNNEPITYAETKLKEQLTKKSSLVSAVPNFKTDVTLFMSAFRSYTKIDEMALPEIEAALQKLKDTKLKKTALNIPFFKEYITDLANAYAARTQEKYGLSIDYLKQRNISQFIASEAIEKYINNQTIKDNLFSEKIRIELATNSLKNEQFVTYLMDHSGQDVKNLFTEKIELLKANKAPNLNAPRKRAFDFKLQDSTGKEYKLDDFKGKMLFIDFWASWCAPCKAQIPYQKELEKNYAGKDIVFMSVSLDQSKTAWLKAVKEEELHGYVLHAEGNFKNDFPKAYAIESIPRYMLIDANGNIISDNMMKPQNKKEISGIIDEELYGKNTSDILEKHFKAIGAESLMKNGLLLEYRQSVVTFNSKSKLYFSYPDKMKNSTQFEETEQLAMMIGKEFFKENYMLVNGDKFSTNNPAFANIKNNWTSKIFGFELFLRKNTSSAVIKFAEENAGNADSCYVLKLVNNGNTEKYFINKKTYLLDKVTTLTANVEPRNGGGFMEAFVIYEDYRNVNGVMIPFKVTQNNIVTIKVEKAEVKPVEAEVFQ